jgi:phosphatidylserine decarboxylase
MSVATYVTAQILRVLPRAQISRAVGHLAELPWPSVVGDAVVGLYTRLYDVALDECEGGRKYNSFDDFFTRQLRSGARHVETDPRAVSSPADGELVSLARIDSGGTLTVKGRPYSVAELVGSEVEAARFVGGTGAVIYLSPRDYHRVHAPVGGHVRRIRSIAGDYYPVNSIGLRYVPALFCRNRRVVIEIDADAGLGRVTVVMVAAIIVGRITTIGVAARDVPFGDHGFEPPIRVDRGQELGVFHLGSTAVVLVEKNESVRWLSKEGSVRLGQAVLRAHSDGRPFDTSARGAWS